MSFSVPIWRRVGLGLRCGTKSGVNNACRLYTSSPIPSSSSGSMRGGPSYDEINAQFQSDSAWIKSAQGKLAMAEFLRTVDVSMVQNMPQRDLDSSVLRRLPTASPEAVRMLSTMLCFPLTLGQAVDELFPSGHEALSRLNVLIVGARAESSLPTQWWREMLVAFHSQMPKQLNLRFLGPGIQPNPSLAKAGLRIDHATSSIAFTHCLTSRSTDPISSHDTLPLHDHPELNSLLRWTDLFVLFNPGFGSVTLKERWQPSIKALLETRKPVLCTAHGDDDLRNDMTELCERIAPQMDDQHLGDSLHFLIKARPNPYASLSPRVHDKPCGTDKEVVLTNKYIYAFHAK